MIRLTMVRVIDNIGVVASFQAMRLPFYVIRE